jgi:hypothetical protein
MCNEGVCRPSLCRECNIDECVTEPGQLNTQTRYRVCFNSAGAQCVERRNSTQRECGCEI